MRNGSKLLYAPADVPVSSIANCKDVFLREVRIARLQIAVVQDLQRSEVGNHLPVYLHPVQRHGPKDALAG